MVLNYQSTETPMYVGRYSRPAYARSATVNTWSTIPLSNTLASLDPNSNPELNPNFPLNAEWRAQSGHKAIFEGWGGACNSEDTVYVPLGGGHGDYAGNDNYDLMLMSDNPTWRMLQPPSGAIGNLLTTNDGQEATGEYADGRPRSIHSYDKPCYVPNVGPFITTQGGCSWSAAPANPSRTIFFHPVTGEHTWKDSIASNQNTSGSGSCFDPSRGEQGSIWYKSRGTGRFSRYDVAQDTWNDDVTDSVAMSGDISLGYIPEHDVIIGSCDFFARNFMVLDCSDGTIHEPQISGSFVGMSLSGTAKPVVVDNYVYFWDNTTNTTIINRMEIPSDPINGTWAISQLTVDPSNTVTPDTSYKANGTMGTYGRFMYFEQLGGFVLCSRYESDWLFFKVK